MKDKKSKKQKMSAIRKLQQYCDQIYISPIGLVPRPEKFLEAMDIIRSLMESPIEKTPIEGIPTWFLKDLTPNSNGFISSYEVLRKKSLRDIKHYLISTVEPVEKDSECYAFVDGSFNDSNGICGYGVYMSSINRELTTMFNGTTRDEDMIAMRNIGGEILASMEAITHAIYDEYPTITIYYDNSGVEHWATGSWKRNLPGTKKYYDFIQSIKNDIELKFIHVYSHTGCRGNEIADRLAKLAVRNGDPKKIAKELIYKFDVDKEILETILDDE